MIILSSSYNILTGQNSVLRGLIAEEFVRYFMSQQFPLLVLRPKIVLRYLDDTNIRGRTVNFVRKYQQTMDFFGLGPIDESMLLQRSAKDLLTSWFYMNEGLPRFFQDDDYVLRLHGFAIEVKSRTTSKIWSSFQYNFSPNQENMFEECNEVGLQSILCGVTFGANWDISIVFANHRGKIIPMVNLLNDLTESTPEKSVE
ncbi:MAG: hypothetical protein ACFFE8_05575 [Candidatus Heimdallarchaeota archaeon]